MVMVVKLHKYIYQRVDEMPYNMYEMIYIRLYSYVPGKSSTQYYAVRFTQTYILLAEKQINEIASLASWQQQRGIRLYCSEYMQL